MIPRRISHHIKEQNWFAVLLDLIVVVAGIFIALQVSQWHSSNEQQAERIYLLEKLAEDINATLEEHKETIENQKIATENFATLITMLSDKPTDNNAREKFFSAYKSIFNILDTVFVSPTFEYILSSGNLEYLGRIETQNHFLQLNTVNVHNIGQTDIANQIVSPVIINIMARIVIPEEVNSTRIGSSLSDIYNFPELLGHIIAIRNINRILMMNMRDIDIVLNKLLAAIHQELHELRD